MNQLPRLLLSALLAACVTGRAQDLPYDSGSTGADGPFTVNLAGPIPPRYAHTAAFDAARGEVVVANGGYFSSFPANATVAFRNDSYAWNGTVWTSKGSNPIPQVQESAMAYDAANQVVVIYGGRNAANTYLNIGATWNGTTWTTQANTAPGLRGHHAMCYEAVAGEVVMFGGYNGSAAVNTTFAWNHATSAWVNKNPTNSPPARYHHAMCWDEARQEIVMFGGWSGSAPLGETWVYRQNTWTQKSPAASPPARYSHVIGYDPASQSVISFGGWKGEGNRLHHDTWSWNGTNWTEVVNTTRALPGRNDAVLVTDTARGQLLLIGGRDDLWGTRDDTWRYDGVASNWVQVAGATYVVDMSARPSGVYQYTTITVPTGTYVDFVPNDDNTPVVWLASGEVDIDGTVNVNGRPGTIRDNLSGENAPGGPGGYAGGLGGYRVEQYNSRSGTPGEGPGGGAPGIAGNALGANGTHQGVYGNAYVIPLLGGSGGGGGASVTPTNADGGNGGGGGGCILIASSRDITVNGAISADGGYYGLNVSQNGTQGGSGSGGAVKLVADRILGAGQIRARNGAGTVGGGVGGYVRLESYLRPFDISGTVSAGNRSNSAPLLGVNYGLRPALRVTSVDGAGVAQPPSGAFDSPDVVFSDAGEVSITVSATNVPDGTPVTVRINHSTAVINLSAQNLAGGTASFTATIPAGFGTVQAFATFDVTP